MLKFLLAAVLIVVDQASKLFVIKWLHQNESIPVIADIFHITLVYNTGSAFGMFRDHNWILTYISVFAIIFILLLLVRRPGVKSEGYHRLWQTALVLILSGAAGNLIDRLKFGYVVDFLDFRIWPVFNFADSLITCGVILLAFLFLRKDVFIENNNLN
ncbi:MAG: signal peptidase II [Candidatus Omnitrophota bacterium]